MKIMKASAGAGKTYQLSQTYRKMLLGSGSPDPFRHILAVTFTNKATDEMKSRILKDLSENAQSDRRAREILVRLLHDYSSFSVCTIDSFFQQTLKAFSREIGQMADYRIELDRDSLIQEAMDRILDSLTEEDRELVGWIRESVRETLENGDRVHLEDGLYDIGKKLKSAEHKSLVQEMNIDESLEFSKERLAAIKKETGTVIESFEKAAKAAAAPFEGGRVKRKSIKTFLKNNPEWAQYYEEHVNDYNTALMLQSLVFNLGLAGEFRRQFDALLKEKNIMCLDESNDILKGIIDGSDAPFVYEKTGVRYDSFLLDEFQDTSCVQWDNFRPLLKESDSRGNENLIVGDVKQSIYRWRNSDWRLLDSKVPECFPGATLETLKHNWRSAPKVIDFNNRLFKWLSDELGVGSIYKDVEQKVGKEQSQGGYVKVEYREDQLEAVLESVRRALEAGARYEDIGIITRTNRDGSDIASYLLDAGIPVISDDSLRIKSSIMVRRLTGLLSAADNPDDSLNSYLVRSLTVYFPKTYHSITDLAEIFIRVLKDRYAAQFDAHTLYVQSFMDALHTWAQANGNNIRDFLSWWGGTDPCLSSPQTSGAVKIMTIHKSKGLEFPYTIVPFTEGIDIFKPEDRWCYMKTEGSAFSKALEGLYPVKLSESSYQSLFAEDFLEEKRMQTVDNLNVFYVALTRAGKCLHVIAKPVPDCCRSSVGKAARQYKNFSQLLFHFIGGHDSYESGEMFDFRAWHAEEKAEDFEEKSFASAYESFDPAGRLVASDDASDFFSEDGLAGPGSSPRLNGIILHDILSRIDRPEDLEASVRTAVADGLLDCAEAERAKDLLKGAIASQPQWFDGSRAFNEQSIIGTDGKEHRPDRIILRNDGSVDIIDYKFGIARDKYVRQVSGYMDLYRRMGHSTVRGWVWMVRDGEVVKV